MTAKSDFGFGIVGAGMIANFHAEAIAATNGGRLVGVATRNVETGQSFGRKYGAELVTTDVAALVQHPDISVVCITTPSGAHLEPALAAIRAGKHVVVEKPIEITRERADQLVREAAAARVAVVPIFQARFSDGARKVHEARVAGRFGRLVLASAYVKWHRAAEYYRGWKGTLALDGGGAVINQAIHAIDQLIWLAGMPRQVFAFATRRVHTGIEAEDTAVAALEFGDGALGTIEATTAAFPGWARRIEIAGENGSAVIEDDRIMQWKFRDSRPGDEELGTARANALGSGASNPAAITAEGHRRQIQDLIDSLRAGRRPTLDGPEGRKAVHLVRAIYESAAAGRPIVLT